MTKKVNTKRALNRAWKLIKVKGIDKATAFDLSWKMERGELPKTKTTAGNDILMLLSIEVKKAFIATLLLRDIYLEKSRLNNMTMDNYRSPKQRAGFASRANKLVKTAASILVENHIAYDQGTGYFYDPEDSQVRVVFTK